MTGSSETSVVSWWRQPDFECVDLRCHHRRDQHASEDEGDGSMACAVPGCPCDIFEWEIL